MKVREAVWPAFGPTKDYACLRITEKGVMATAAIPRYSDGKIVVEGAHSAVDMDDFLKAVVMIYGEENARRLFDSALGAP